MKNFEFRLSLVNTPWVLIYDSLAKTESDFVKSSQVYGLVFNTGGENIIAVFGRLYIKPAEFEDQDT